MDLLFSEIPSQSSGTMFTFSFIFPLHILEHLVSDLRDVSLKSAFGTKILICFQMSSVMTVPQFLLFHESLHDVEGYR